MAYVGSPLTYQKASERVVKFNMFLDDSEKTIRAMPMKQVGFEIARAAEVVRLAVDSKRDDFHSYAMRAQSYKEALYAELERREALLMEATAA